VTLEQLKALLENIKLGSAVAPDQEELAEDHGTAPPPSCSRCRQAECSPVAGRRGRPRA